MTRRLLSILFLIGGIYALVSCGEDEPNLAPPAERIATAISDLRSSLLSPTNGWKVEYKPTSESGSFFMLLDFDEDGTVNIQSDVPANDGEFHDQTITYRIDNSLGLELILDTYGVFHYLFELDDTQFGAEFEFLYDSMDGENLIFRSKTDITDITTLVFEPAAANDADLFGIEIAQGLDAFTEIGVDDGTTRQQLFIADRNISVFWAADLEQRNMVVEFAGVGDNADEIIQNQVVLLDHSTSYSLVQDLMVLDEPFSFVLNGFRNEISVIRLGEFENTGPSLCATGPDTNPIFSGFTPGLGNMSVQNTVLSTSGLGFTPDVYTVNSFFIFDDEGNSLADDEEGTGIIYETWPDVIGFAFLYGVELNDPDIPIFSVGFILEEGDLYLREFTPTTTAVNRVEIELLDEYFFRTEPEGSPVPPGTQESLKMITDEIFAGGEIYAYDFPIEGFEIFRLYNPCNEYEFLLVK